MPAHDAVRINAAMVHSLEFDDTFGRGFLLPSAITFPAAFAVADMVGGISGREFLAASTAAIDVACRLSIASQPSVDGFTAGWHNTTIIGYLSTALLAARLMKRSHEQTINAVGIAYHQAAGNSQSHIDSALTKRLGPGFASSAGVLAARLAAKGVSGPAGVLEGKKGWWQQYHKGNYSRALMFDGLGRDFPAMEMPSIPTFMAIRLPRAMARFPPRATGKAWGPAMADHFRRPSRACTAGISRTSPMSR